LTVYFAIAIQKNYKDSTGGEFERSLWVRRWAYLKLRQEWTAGWS